MDLAPEDVLLQLEGGRLLPFYLFYGPSEFQLERVLRKIRDSYIPDEVKELNLEIFYGDEVTPSEILHAAQSLPFLSEKRLIIVRRVENFSVKDLEGFLRYLDKPAETTCLIFISTKPDFKRKFYRRIRSLGRAVHFRSLNDHQVIPWIKMMASDLGLKIEGPACAYLQQMVGVRLRDLYSELEKLYLRYGRSLVGVRQVREVSVYSRSYTIFELIDRISFRQCAESISVLKRFLEEGGREDILRVLGMLNRQIGLLWRAKGVVRDGGRSADVAKHLELPKFLVSKILQQSKCWKAEDLERAVDLLYQADGLIKSGSQGHLVLENLVLSMCA